MFGAAGKPCSWWASAGRCHKLSSTSSQQYRRCPLSCGVCQPPLLIAGTACAIEGWQVTNLSLVHPVIDGRHPRYDGVLKRTSVRDGGQDMYDVGNRIHARAVGSAAWGPSSDPRPLPYTQSCGGRLRATGLGDILYATCRTATVFAAVFVSESSSIGGFRTSGGLGHDGRGTTAANVVPLLAAASAATAGATWHGFFKSVSGACRWSTCSSGTHKPSVNHLIASPVAGDHTWAASTDDDGDELSLPAGAPLLYYLMWGGEGPEGYEEADFQRVLDAISAACPLPPHPPPSPPPPPPPPRLPDEPSPSEKQALNARNGAEANDHLLGTVVWIAAGAGGLCLGTLLLFLRLRRRRRALEMSNGKTSVRPGTGFSMGTMGPRKGSLGGASASGGVAWQLGARSMPVVREVQMEVEMAGVATGRGISAGPHCPQPRAEADPPYLRA